MPRTHANHTRAGVAVATMNNGRLLLMAMVLVGAVSALGWLLHVTGLAYWLWMSGLAVVALFGLVWPKPLISLASATKLDRKSVV